jgi:membrane-bound lytic murein transglycosylase B
MSRGVAAAVRLAIIALVSGAVTAPVLAQDYPFDPSDVAARRAAFISRMVEKHGFESGALTGILGGAEIQQTVLNSISRPAERVVPWYEYRGIFLNDERIDSGARFWIEHEALIGAMADRYGLEPEMMLAIVGIESRFGERMGTYRVVDSLSTLAFAYPPRADFFAGELESFLLIYAEEGDSVLDATGSYAGAMGAGQFIPSSYRAYAIDADADGHRDLWGNWNDILASVANYFVRNGWRGGEPIVFAATQGDGPSVAPNNRLELDTTVGALRDSGYEFTAPVDAQTPAMLVAVEGDAANTAYWVGLHNFRVITRYNRSVKYALAAFELSRAIRQRYLALAGEAG